MPEMDFSAEEDSGFADLSVGVDVLKAVADRTLGEIGLFDSSFSVAFVSSSRMAKMNGDYRGVDGPTDVLSFRASESSCPGFPDVSDEGKAFIGDICVCPSVVRENAERFGEEPGTELLRVFVHGLLHLGGMDHDDVHVDESGEWRKSEMLSLQETLVAEFSGGRSSV